jgi:DNA-binding CsgD family transcriptional regulator
MTPLKKFLQQLFQQQEEKKKASGETVDDLDFENRVFEIAEAYGISPNAVLHMASLAAEEHNEKLANWHKLTPRQQEVAALICGGYTNREIARQLNISISTVKTHIRYILPKFKLNSKDQLRQYFEGWDFSHFQRS